MKFFYSALCLSSLLGIEVSAVNAQQEETQLRKVTPPESQLKLLSVDLAAWGAKDSVRPNKDVHTLSDFDVQPINVMRWFSARGVTKLRLLFCSAAASLLLMGVFLVVWKSWWSNSDLDISEIADANLDVATVVDRGTGSWVKTYRGGSVEQREALDLLLRCKIISAQEFAHSGAAQDHIDECILISMQMLRQKPLQEWVSWRQQALESFEDSITAIFAARMSSTAQSGKHGFGMETWAQDYLQMRDLKAPPTPPMQGAFKDLLILKGGFQTPLVRSQCNSNASTVQASPATPGRLPLHSHGVPFKPDGLDITFDIPDTVNCGPQPSIWPASTFEQRSLDTRHRSPLLFRPLA